MKIYKLIKKFSLVFISISLLFIASSCTKNESDNDKLNIVTTTTMICDLAKNIGGDAVEVTGLMSYGIDPHLYKASAQDVTKLQTADVVIYNGLHLEGQMGEIFESLDKLNKDVICLEDALTKSDIISSADSNTSYDPHIWFNTNLWIKCATYVSKQLSIIDEEFKDYYNDNLNSYIEELNKLENYIKNQILKVKEEQRVLITAHDAFSYFGKAYGFKVLGLQGISTEAEAGTADVSLLATFIADNKIKAIFVESSIPKKNIEALQAAVKHKGFDVVIGGELYSDSLGDEASKHDTYISTFKSNIDTIVSALK